MEKMPAAAREHTVIDHCRLLVEGAPGRGGGGGGGKRGVLCVQVPPRTCSGLALPDGRHVHFATSLIFRRKVETLDLRVKSLFFSCVEV